ncbi:MAG: phosphoesterase [Pirellulales bacterium]|nr:phosphoesterase [Pirellulales bacterium]
MTAIATVVEQILVIPTSLLHEIGHFQGFSAEIDRYLPKILDPRVASYRPRPQMEEDPTFKQLIPYVVFAHGAAEGPLTVFQYTRGTGQGEKRLHAKRSIGVGGHICSDDRHAGESTVYLEGMRRELAEEVEWNGAAPDRIIGLINDDLTPVGQVHLGVVHLVMLPQPGLTAREAAMVDAGFVPLPRLLEELDQFETWSQYALAALGKMRLS